MKSYHVSQRKLSTGWVVALFVVPIALLLAGIQLSLRLVSSPAVKPMKREAAPEERRADIASRESVPEKRSTFPTPSRLQLSRPQPLGVAPAFPPAPSTSAAPDPLPDGQTPISVDDMHERWAEEEDDAAWSESVRSFVESVLRSDASIPPSVNVECRETICRMVLKVDYFGRLTALQEAVGSGGQTRRIKIDQTDAGVEVTAYVSPDPFVRTTARTPGGSP
jgi:hypothetical protein